MVERFMRFRYIGTLNVLLFELPYSNTYLTRLKNRQSQRYVLFEVLFEYFCNRKPPSLETVGIFKIVVFKNGSHCTSLGTALWSN